MRPDLRDLDDEIRGHLALAIQERVDRGEAPDAARRAALRELGYIAALRDDMRRVWYSRWGDAAVATAQDVRVGVRSLLRARGLSLTIIVTLALGIGANAAIFSVVRGVLLRPLVNRGEDRLVYIRQSAPGLGVDNLTFSVPEIRDLRAGSTAFDAFGEFSTVEFTMTGVGEPRVIRAGVVDGSYFDVMGLRPVLGRLIARSDDGGNAEPVAVLTHRFWTVAFNSDPGVVGQPLHLGGRTATIVGILEPSVPYPAETEVIANMVTSPHHLGATMVTQRTHRMTELFGRLSPGATLESARAEISAAYDAMIAAHPDSYGASADMVLRVTTLRDQIASPARPVLLILLTAAAAVFVIACSNVANLMLARSVRREGELAVRAALGASRGALRRTLFAESAVLCGVGAALGVLLAQPMLAVVARFAARFSVRALDVTVDATLLWVGAALAMAASLALAYVPRLPSTTAPAGLGLGQGSIRLTPSTTRRLRVFAVAQIAGSFVLLAVAAALLAALIAMQSADTGYDMRGVLAINLPARSVGAVGVEQLEFYDEVARRASRLPGVSRVAFGNVVPWRDAGAFGPPVTFAVEGYEPADGEEEPRARFRIVSPHFFEVLGVPIIAGRDFSADDRLGSEAVVIVSASVAARLFPNGDALNRRMWWTDAYFGGTPFPRRIVGIVGDVDDENIVRQPAMAIYHPVRQIGVAGRLFVRADGDPRALAPAITRVIRQLSAEQAVERAATLEDVRAEVLAPERLNAFVFAGFAAVAVLIAVVGVSGVLAFGVSARVREFGVRLAVGLAPRQLLLIVLREGLVIVSAGIAAGVAGGYFCSQLASRWVDGAQVPGSRAIVVAALALTLAALVASLVPAARAARVDVLRALRTE